MSSSKLTLTLLGLLENPDNFESIFIYIYMYELYVGNKKLWNPFQLQVVKQDAIP